MFLYGFNILDSIKTCWYFGNKETKHICLEILLMASAVFGVTFPFSTNFPPSPTPSTVFVFWGLPTLIHLITMRHNPWLKSKLLQSKYWDKWSPSWNRSEIINLTHTQFGGLYKFSFIQLSFRILSWLVKDDVIFCRKIENSS